MVAVMRPEALYPRMHPFTRYIAMGDSKSIDYYPGKHLLEDLGGECAPHFSGLGASSLLFKNLPQHHPEFASRDLYFRSGTTFFDNLCTDGADTLDLLSSQAIDAIDNFFKPGYEISQHNPALVTITIGGNDLLGTIGERDEEKARLMLGFALNRISLTVEYLFAAFMEPTVLISNVYDPTDSTGKLVTPIATLDVKELLPRLYWWNDQVETLVQKLQRKFGHQWVRLIDLYGHFLGHGFESGDCWYWPQSMIEPGIRGASEIRRMWLKELER